MTAHTTEPDPGRPAAHLGYQDAARIIIAAQYASGIGLDQIQQHHDDRSAGLLSDTQTSVGRSYASVYADTSQSLIADLRADAAAATREPEPAGTAHPDQRLAERGWQRCENGCGVYVRRTAEAHSEADREAD